MLNFAEQTGSGAVMLVWSFSLKSRNFTYLKQHTDWTAVSLGKSSFTSKLDDKNNNNKMTQMKFKNDQNNYYREERDIRKNTH